MKRLFLISCAVCALSLAVSAQETIDLQINDVKVLTTRAEVVQKFGKPLSSRKKVDGNACRGNLRVLRYPGMILELEDGTPQEQIVIATTTVTSPKWSVSGIKIGANIDEVRKKFSSGEAGREKDLDHLFRSIGDGFADFVFRKGKLIKIYWEFNFC